MNEIEDSNLDRYQWENLINRWVFDEVDRKILKRKILDNVSLEKISEEVGFSTSQTKRRWAKSFKKLVKRL